MYLRHYITMIPLKNNMQERHSDRLSYFYELARTSRDFYLDYLGERISLHTGMKVLEIGCGEGGNLLPFAEEGCSVTGIDRSETRIAQARQFFADAGQKGTFIHCDFFEVEWERLSPDGYSIILVHDVIEHIPQEMKVEFMKRAHQLLAPEGIIFWGFPAWQMPFGGHQQICRSRLCSKLPFIHLLPHYLYRRLLYACGESDACVDELLDIRACHVSVERFEAMLRMSGGQVLKRTLWFINPHYRQKFGLRPVRLSPLPGYLPYLRNFFCTACFYLTRK